MRLRTGKWWLAAGLVVGGIVVLPSLPELRHGLRRHQFQVDGLEQALPSQVYLLETNRWLEFRIPEDTPLVRLISNAAVASTNTAPSDTRFPYAIEYAFEDEPGRVIASDVYHFKARPLQFLDARTGRPVEVNSYLEPGLRPLGGRRFMLNLADPALANARVLRLRLQDSHPQLLETAVRVYYQARIPARKVGYQWNRLSEDQKRDLTRGNVYSFEGLTDRERRGLLSTRWAAAAPEGIPDRDFLRRKLFIRDDSENLTLVQDWVPSGVPVDAAHTAFLPFTNAPGSRTLRMVADPGAGSARAFSTLVWHGDRREAETRSVAWSGTNETVVPSDREGFLEVRSSRPAHVRAFDAAEGRTREITPEPTQLLAFTVGPTNTLEYVVDHAGGESAFFRVDWRRFTLAAAGVDRVHYTLLDASGDRVRQGAVALTNTVSAHDWLVTTNGLTNISVAQSLCFELPPSVRRLRFESPETTVLANAYTRPSQLVKRVRVPEDYLPASPPQPEQPTWFSVRPADHTRRRQAGLCQRVRIQYPPTEEDPRVQAGRYEWESFLPANEWRGQMLLLPTTDAEPPRPESLPFSYSPVAVGSPQRVRFQGPTWEPEVAPSLMLISETDTPGSAVVTVDGQPLLDTRLEAPVTQLGLGPLTVGDHTLEIRASHPVSAHVNYCVTQTNAAYVQRFCVMAGSNTLHFPYVKRQPGDELLVLRVFSPAEEQGRPFDVHLKLKPSSPRGTGPFPGITVLERDARVTPNAVCRTRRVAATPSWLDDGQPVFLRVGQDVPPGQHEVEVIVRSTSPRWLSLSRTTPGVVEKLELSSNRRAE